MDNAVQPSRIPHTRTEDALAIVLGTLMVSFGVILLKQAGALTGGTAGVAFLISYLSPLS
ncbi:YitT family protein, partial [Pantoea sp. R102]